MKVLSHRTVFARRLATASAALLGTALTPLPAMAQNGTWNGATADFNVAGNWNPAGVPTNLARLGSVGQSTVAVTADSALNELLFLSGAQQYQFINAANLTINGIGAFGIVNEGILVQTVINNGTMTFNNNAAIFGLAGSGGIFFENRSNAGSTPTLIFNNNSAIGANVNLLGTGAAVSAVGTNLIGADGSITFNSTSSADNVTMTFSGGTGGAQAGATAASGFGGSHGVVFNDSTHADNANILNTGGNAIAVTNMDPLLSATAVGGSSSISFNDTSHADGATIENRGGSPVTFAGMGSATAVGGTASVSFSDDSHADNATFTNVGSLTTAIGGTGAIGTPGGNGVAGGPASASGGGASIFFFGNSHADNSDFLNSSGQLNLLGGSGGMGDTGTGGEGGSASGNSGSVSILFLGNSHANNATFTMTPGTTAVSGGAGGQGGSTGVGGLGGGASGTGGSSVLQFSNGTGTTGATIVNTGGNAIAAGGVGGIGGSGAAGGQGGNATATGSGAFVFFTGTASAGTGTTITNQGGNASAVGGQGGLGGSGAAGTGGLGGDATATGGDATVVFSDTSNAGSATITNTAGMATATSGNGGNGNVGAGGDGGLADAIAGNAYVTFNQNSSAGNATIVNQASPFPNVGIGTPGTVGGGGGAAGGAGFTASGNIGSAFITFNNASTAANATITNSGNVYFNDTATGGSSRITNQRGSVEFSDSSVFGTAAGALITLNGGLVLFQDNSSLGSGSINNAGGTFNFSGTSTGGTGSIVNTAGGFGRFQDNSTSGSATINNAGNFGYLGNASAGTSVITNSGSLGFSGTSDAVGARVISTATGTTFVDVNAFRLGSLSGTGSVVINSLSFQVGYLDLNETFSGVISGGGQLLKRGTGTFTLTGANTYTGVTNITAGTLQLDGSLASSTVAVAAGATLRGIGRTSGTMSIAGTVSPGNAANPLGTLTADFGVTFVPGSVLAPTITSAGQSSLLQAGSLFLNANATVRPTALPGGLFLMQTDYRVANGATGRFGTFGGVDESLLPTFLDASLFYAGNDVFLRVRRNATTFAQTAGLTPNQDAVSTALDAAVAANNPLVYTDYLSTYNALLGLGTNGPLQGALNTLSGDALTVLPVAAQEHASRFARRLDSYTWSNSSNVWGLIAYGDQEADGDGNGPGFDSEGLEFQMGFNTSLGANTRLGLSVGYVDADVDSSDRLLIGDIETWSVGAQLRHDFGPAYVSGQLTYSWHNIDSSRALLVAGNATAGFDATTWTAAAEFGGVFRTGNMAVEPHVSLRHASTDQDAYSESGPAGALDVVAADYETTRFGVGVRLANRDPQAPVRFHALVRYEHETGDRRSVLDNALPGLPAFTVLGTRLGGDILSGELGVEFRISNGVSLFASGGGHTRANETSLNANAGLRIAF